MMPAFDEVLLTDDDLARLTGRPKSWYAKLRMTGNGPRFLKIGGKVRYRRGDYEAWLATCERESTAERAA
jgi:predicted DNA-binding transcriptional regulator AlpA